MRSNHYAANAALRRLKCGGYDLNGGAYARAVQG